MLIFSLCVEIFPPCLFASFSSSEPDYKFFRVLMARLSADSKHFFYLCFLSFTFHLFSLYNFHLPTTVKKFSPPLPHPPAVFNIHTPNSVRPHTFLGEFTLQKYSSKDCCLNQCILQIWSLPHTCSSWIYWGNDCTRREAAFRSINVKWGSIGCQNGTYLRSNWCIQWEWGS